MPSMTLEDRVRELEGSSATTVERLNNLNEHAKQIDAAVIGANEKHRELDKQLALLSQKTDLLEKTFNELVARRWELWKLVLASFLGGLLTVAAGFLSGVIERFLK